MKIGFFGTPEYSAKLLKELIESNQEISFVVTNPDKPFGRDRKLKPSPVKEVAISHNVPVFQYDSIKKVENPEFKNIPTDLYFVFAYGGIIPRSIFDIPKLGTINLHGSLLPQFRGASPIQSAILANKTETGATLQYIVEELDAGDIISQEKFSIDITDNFPSLIEKLTQAGKNLLLEFISQNPKDRVAATKQDVSKASFCKKIKPEETKLDLGLTALEFHNKVRAFYPDNTAFAHFRGKRLNICQTEFLDETIDLPVGTIFPLDKKTPAIVCGDNRIVRLKLLQQEGKKVLSGSDFLNGSKLVTGEKIQ
ncbi:MAG: methionyl-tRNA formyltransferase [Leptospiraceae bacterium]|nr:methionyl-tRNA formyltransferase [Leptospiraceae bacterium]